MEEESKIRIDVWSDYVCPYCYLELPLLDRLQEEYGPRIEIYWRAYELRPEPAPPLDPSGDYLRTAWTSSVYPLAKERGMVMRLPPIQPRSRKALEAAAHARSEGQFDEMHRAILRAFFEEGRDIGDMRVLLDIAAAVGLDPLSLKNALDEGRYTEAVLQDQRLAYDLGLSAVPTMLVRPADAPLQSATPVRGAVPYKQLYAAVKAAANSEPS